MTNFIYKLIEKSLFEFQTPFFDINISKIYVILFYMEYFGVI